MSLSLCRKRRSREGSGAISVCSDITTATKGNYCDDRQRRKRQVAVEESTPNGMKTTTQDDMPSCSQAKRSKRNEASLSNSQVALEAGRCGTIKKVVLFNFMCHSNYCIEMHPRVNFMVGRNGSGKSAIIAALVVGLGGRARATNRSTAIHSLIKNGQNSGRVEITIANEGLDAYKPEIYGDQITIIRNISQSSSNYKIKDARGRIVAENLDELKRIIDMHNIQVDNPAFVMNQDSAREFLKEMEPRKNYQLFLKATQLDSIQNQLYKCGYDYQDHKQRLQLIGKKLEQDQQRIMGLEREYNKLLSFAQLKHEINQKKTEYEWSLVIRMETEISEIEEELAAEVQQYDKLEEQAQSKNEIETEHKAEINQCMEIIKLKRREYTEKNEYCQSMNANLKEKAKNVHGLKYDVENFNKRIKHLETQIVDLQQHIAQRSKSMGVEELRRSNAAELEVLHKKHREKKAMSDSAKREHQIFVENKSQKEEDCRNFKFQIDNCSRRMDNLKRDIANLQMNEKNRFSIYGQDMQTLLDEIDRYCRAGKFSERPRGPIASYLDVPEQKYRDAVENQIGGLLRAFIVNNTADRVLLNKIAQQCCPNLPVIAAKFLRKVHDVRSGSVRPPPNTRLLLDVIKCRDPVVMNCLIDHLSIETVLLTDTKNVAEHFTIQQEQVPQNLRKIVVATQPALEYFPDPKFRMYSFNIKPARLIQVNVDECIRQLEHEYGKIENDKLRLHQSFAEAERELNASKIQLTEKLKLMQRHNEEVIQLEQRISDLENFEYPDTNETFILQKELTENERKLEEYMTKLEKKQEECKNAENQKQNVEIELKKYNDKLNEIQRSIREKETEANEIQMRLRGMLDNLPKFEEKKKRLQERIEMKEANKTAKQRELGNKLRTAQKRGERFETERAPEEIFDDIQVSEAKLKQGAPIKEDPQKLEEEIKRSKRTLSVDRSTLKTLTLVVGQLRHSQVKRMNFVKHFRGHMVTMLQYTFNKVLNMRRFTGSIEVNHKEQSMEISVVPRDNHIADAVTNTRSLSGGERSYTTVAFLISLWACVDHPFFFLDEYDVFADEVNREYMTRLLLNEGKRRTNRQFVFLTPQDMTVEASDYISIHRLAEPARN